MRIITNLLLLAAIALSVLSAAPFRQDGFIWTHTNDKSADAHVVFRKTFMASEVSEGSVRIFADARYILWINGQYVARGPCRFDPAGPEFDTLDVGRFLTKGRNAVAVMVMPYPVGSKATSGKMKRHDPGLKMTLTAGDGTNGTVVRTDASWKWKSGLRYGTPSINWGFVKDTVDARLDDGDWTLVDYDDSEWSAAAAIPGGSWGPLRPRFTPLMMENDVPVSGEAFPISVSRGKEFFYMLPRMVQGYIEIDVESATDGSSLRIDLSQRGSATSIAPENYAYDFKYTAKAGRRKCFTTDDVGFRYIRVSGTDGDLTLHGLRVVDRRYPYVDAGAFTSSDPWLNDLWERAVHTMRMTSSDGYLDCALRERAEWMGDGAVVQYPVTRVTLAGPEIPGEPLRSDAGLMVNMIRHTAQSATQFGDGRMKAHACSDRLDKHAYIEDYSCLWVQSLREVYDHTGNVELVREVWPELTAQMKWFLDRRTDRGLVKAREFVIFDNPVKYITCEGATLNAFVYRALLDAALLADVIGRASEAGAYRKDAEALKAKFNKHLWDAKSGSYVGGLNEDGSPTGLTCHAAMLALDRGIVPPDRVESVTKYFLKTYRSQIGMPYTAYWALENIYKLDTAERDREALDYIRGKWKDVMERTDTGTLTEGFNSGESCHNFGGSCAYFMSSYILGARLDGPASNGRIIVEPRLSGLSSAKGAVVTELGVVPVAWTLDGGKLDLKCTVPPGAKARIRIPQLAESKASRLVLDGKPVTSPVIDGRYSEVPVGPGVHHIVAHTAP
jgi:alpha-L-rhamnosidase